MEVDKEIETPEAAINNSKQWQFQGTKVAR